MLEDWTAPRSALVIACPVRSPTWSKRLPLRAAPRRRPRGRKLRSRPRARQTPGERPLHRLYQRFLILVIRNAYSDSREQTARPMPLRMAFRLVSLLVTLVLMGVLATSMLS